MRTDAEADADRCGGKCGCGLAAATVAAATFAIAILGTGREVQSHRRAAT
jgi:hypothetical protein